MTQLEVPSAFRLEVEVPSTIPSYLSPPSFLRRIALSYAQYARHLAQARDGRILELGFAVLGDGGYLDAYKNVAVVMEHLSEPQLRELSEAKEAFYGKSTNWMLGCVAPQSLAGCGLQRLQSDNQVAFLPEAAKAMLAAGHEHIAFGLEIREVINTEGLYEYERTRYAARSEQGFYIPACGLPDDRVLDETNRYWIGYVEDRPVATGALFEHDGISLMKGLAVNPSFRGRGFARAMMVHRIRRASGTPMVDLDTPARPLAAKLGFVPVGAYGYWTPGESDYREDVPTITPCH